MCNEQGAREVGRGGCRHVICCSQGNSDSFVSAGQHWDPLKYVKGLPNLFVHPNHLNFLSTPISLQRVLQTLAILLSLWRC